MPTNDRQSSSPSDAQATPVPAPVDPLNRLRTMRKRFDRTKGIGDDLAIHMQSVKKISNNEKAAIDAWTTAVPDIIRDSTRVSGLKAGKLIVLVPTSAQRFVVDRWLGSGGFSQIQALARVPIIGIVLKIDLESY